MKVKRYDLVTSHYDGGGSMDEYDDGDYIHSTDYDALLALARRLRKVAMGLWATEDDTDYHTVVSDSAWLEE